MKERYLNLLMEHIKLLILLITLLFPIILKSENNIKILFISGSTNNIELTSDCKLGFLQELYDNRKKFDKIQVRQLYLNTFDVNSSYILLEKRLKDITARIEKYNPNVIIAIDDPSFFVICRIYWKFKNKPKIYYYGLTKDAKTYMKEKSEKEFPLSGIKPGLNYNLFIKVFESKFATHQILVITPDTDIRYSDKTSHNLTLLLKDNFRRSSHGIRVVSVKSIYDLESKLNILKEKQKHYIIFNMSLGLPYYDNSKSLIPTEEITKIIKKKMKYDIVVSLTYRSAQDAVSISYGPNFYQDGKNLFNLVIETYSTENNKEIESEPAILAFNLNNFYNFYSDLIYQIKMNNNKQIFYY